MNDWASPDERFVEIPGVIEIRWVSDDPEYYHPPIDLFDEQKNGLPDYYGKKDKQTTEQSYFTCCLCECELKSVVTLRAHCKGTQHIRKALQKKSEYRKQQKRLKAVEEKPMEEQFKTLFDWLESTSEAVVGLEFITEYHSGSPNDSPLYHCKMKNCQDEQGDALYIKNHILSLKHKQNFIEFRYHSFLKHQTEIQQAVADYTKEYSRDYRLMNVETDPGKYQLISRQQLVTPRTNSRSPSPDREESYGRREKEIRCRSRSPRRSRSRSKSTRSPRRQRSRSRSRQKDRRGRDRSRSPRRYQRDRHRSRSPKKEPWDRYSNIKREERSYRDRHEDNHRNGRRKSTDNSRSERVKRETYDDDEIQEVGRSGDFANWKTAQIKTSRDDDNYRDSHNSASNFVADPSSSLSTVDEDIQRLHKRVAQHVMDNLNKYYPGSDEFQPHLHKITSPEEYTKIARTLSRDLRKRIKEGYEAYNNGELEGIRLTPDHKAFIEHEVERFFENKPLIR